MWMNEDEIDRALEMMKDRAPELVPYAQFLSDWRDIVNASSDGWPYWKAGAKAAEKLMVLVDQAVQSTFRHGIKLPEPSEMAKALAPIRSAATRFKLPKPELKEAEETPCHGAPRP